MTPVVKYFKTEKFLCYTGIGLSILSIAIAFLLLSLLPGIKFLKGLAYPLICLPTCTLTVCIFLLFKASRDNRINYVIQNQPERIRIEEFPRMKKILKNLMAIKILTALLAMLGLYLLLATSSWVAGTGLGLFIQSSLLYSVVHLAIKGGSIYWTFLQSTYRLHQAKLGFKLLPSQKF